MHLVARTCALLAVLAAATPAWAYLGGFEPADGYVSGAVPQSSPNPASQYTDVTYYNAGQSGPNAGGGSALSAVPDSGLWDLLTQPGAFFRTAADRTTNTGTAPPYAPFPAFSAYDVPAYIVGNHFGGHTGTALVMRNETPWNAVPVGGPIEYEYDLDIYDFGGINPASVTSGTQTMSFFFKPCDPGLPGSDGRFPDRFIMTVHDSSGNIGLQLGYTQANEVQWRDDPSSSWNTTGIIADWTPSYSGPPTTWDQFIVKLDLTNDTFLIDYYQESTTLTTNLAPLGTPMGNAMTDFTNLDWWLKDQTLGGLGGKVFFDDFGFNVVPEPSSMSLLALGGLGLIAVIKRRRTSK